MSSQPRDSQDPLPFDDTGSGAISREESDSEDPGEGRRSPGRPRVWASEAERKRAYREQLAADFAEPERLRRELRSARKAIADKDREISRLKRDLTRSEAATEDLLDRYEKLEQMIGVLESKVETWRSRAGALVKRRDEDQSQHDAGDRRRRPNATPRPRLELPNLHTKGIPPAPPKGVP